MRAFVEITETGEVKLVSITGFLDDPTHAPAVETLGCFPVRLAQPWLEILVANHNYLSVLEELGIDKM